MTGDASAVPWAAPGNAQEAPRAPPPPAEAEEPQVSVSYHVPRALDLAGEGGREVGVRTAAAGLVALPHMAEIYPVGGEARLTCCTAPPRPTAFLASRS